MFSASNANWFAYFALIAFLPLGILAYRSLPTTRATLLLVFAGVMFLPEVVDVDLPLLPRLGKESIVYLSAMLGMIVTHRSMIARSRPGRGIEALIFIMILGGIITVLTNGDPLSYGPHQIQGIAPYESITSSMLELFRYGLPFYLGRLVIRTRKDLEEVLLALMLAGVIYTVFMAVELRLSPQMHRWTYGFHQNGFDTLKRWGGYRPMLYMSSALALAIFMVNTLMAALTSLRARIDIRGISAKLIAPYLLVFLILTKSLAAMIYGIVFTPLMLVLRPRRLAAVACVLAVFVILYPTLRMTDLFPWRGIVDFAASYDSARAASLKYRFENDENMLAKTRNRLMFGWGGYSRNWAYDDTTGRRLTVPDGAWIIRLSSNGLVGFYCLYGLYTLPVILAFLRFKNIKEKRSQIMMAGLMAIVVIRAIDQLPNGLYTSYPIFLAGALYNLSRSLPAQEARRRQAARERRLSAADPPERSSESAPETRSGSTAVLLGVRKDSDAR